LGTIYRIGNRLSRGKLTKCANSIKSSIEAHWVEKSGLGEELVGIEFASLFRKVRCRGGGRVGGIEEAGLSENAENLKY
jgi:hypothetical protein